MTLAEASISSAYLDLEAPLRDAHTMALINRGLLANIHGGQTLTDEEANTLAFSAYQACKFAEEAMRAWKAGLEKWDGQPEETL